MNCVGPTDPNYDADRRISNARFDYRPASICYCENAPDKARDVVAAIRKAKAEGRKVRIRSGGHQHEGMCSGNGTLIIDVSKIDNLAFSKDLETVQIGAGAKLKNVYDQTWANHRLLPGGGCDDVRIGGLVQGGGWGPYSRELGLTCDRLSGFSMVLADEKKIEVTDEKGDPYHDLFWAVAGGGGGNFGVITEFRFKLAPLRSPIFQFTITWDQSQMKAVITEWLKNFPRDQKFKLTSFCRLSGPSDYDKPVVVAGFFLGEQDPLEAHLKRLLPTTYASKVACKIDPVYPPKTSEARRAFHPEYQPGPPPAALLATMPGAEGAPGDLTTTCNGAFFPHKVSSCFPRWGFSSVAVDAIVSYLRDAKAEPTARRYLSLHCMGGNIDSDPNRAREWSCFPYRDKPFMLQYQAWWANKDDKPLGGRCLDWVRNFRETMKPHTEGSFINFPDKDLAPERKDLLRYYYAGNLEKLIAIKAKYDPGNFFDFEMGIPTK
jgi:hypothetical protein